MTSTVSTSASQLQVQTAERQHRRSGSLLSSSFQDDDLTVLKEDAEETYNDPATLSAPATPFRRSSARQDENVNALADEATKYLSSPRSSSVRSRRQSLSPINLTPRVTVSSAPHEIQASSTNGLQSLKQHDGSFSFDAGDASIELKLSQNQSVGRRTLHPTVCNEDANKNNNNGKDIVLKDTERIRSSQSSPNSSPPTSLNNIKTGFNVDMTQPSFFIYYNLVRKVDYPCTEARSKWRGKLHKKLETYTRNVGVLVQKLDATAYRVNTIIEKLRVDVDGMEDRYVVASMLGDFTPDDSKLPNSRRRASSQTADLERLKLASDLLSQCTNMYLTLDENRKGLDSMYDQTAVLLRATILRMDTDLTGCWGPEAVSKVEEALGLLDSAFLRGQTLLEESCVILGKVEGSLGGLAVVNKVRR
ncbi:hypothetical protein HDU76_002298 [Blyttiomyces sp. JEL0837]|nr:hypothetical protein HDU76_002298 [Blyttiomyces sp. JEL0837]